MSRLKHVVLFVAMVAALGCGGSDSGDPESGGPDARAAVDASIDAEPLLLSDIEVTVVYEGAHDGDLIVGAFLDYPAMGPPLAFSQDDDPSFPAAVTLRNLEPNSYYVIAVLDLPPASPTAPGEEDLVVGSDELVLDGEADHSVTVTITDPEEE